MYFQPTGASLLQIPAPDGQSWVGARIVAEDVVLAWTNCGELMGYRLGASHKTQETAYSEPPSLSWSTPALGSDCFVGCSIS